MICRKYFSNFLVKQNFTSSKLYLANLTRNSSMTAKSVELNSFSRRKKNNTDIGWILLVLPISAFGLGTWQVRRKIWKENLIQELKSKTKFPALDFPENEKELTNLEYRRIKVIGEFDHSKELYLGPRSCLTDGGAENSNGLFSGSGSTNSGYYVITPFKLSNRPYSILVNRGWVSMKNKNPASRLSGQVAGEIELEGVVRLTESRPQFVTKNVADSRFWAYRDLEAMSKIVDSEPIMIDAVVECSIPGGPIGGQTNISLRNEHVSYIITWYGLAVATGYMWYAKYSHALRSIIK
ncbi:surfeit locus protein 1 isoform X1 [Rhopalosiphum padi]|uniref:surfeit locus protein 1 isoform X1 n=2 Tax=Rhopalosiphum padi TaxID=40932 RepID=UPI00298D7657|nr:surfeit locus protein 1 isoform X1 [Rhopalosiphum padi]